MIIKSLKGVQLLFILYLILLLCRMFMQQKLSENGRWNTTDWWNISTTSKEQVKKSKNWTESKQTQSWKSTCDTWGAKSIGSSSFRSWRNNNLKKTRRNKFSLRSSLNFMTFGVRMKDMKVEFSKGSSYLWTLTQKELKVWSPSELTSQEKQ